MISCARFKGYTYTWSCCILSMTNDSKLHGQIATELLLSMSRFEEPTSPCTHPFLVNMQHRDISIIRAMMFVFPATLPHILHSLTLPCVASTCLEMISAFFSASIFQRCSSDACAARDTSRASSDKPKRWFQLGFATALPLYSR